MSTPARAEQDGQQGLNNDECGEFCVAMAAEVRGAFTGAEASKALADGLWDRVNPGVPKDQQGTTLAGERTAIGLVPEFYPTLDVSPISLVATGDELVAAVRAGFFVVCGVRLVDLLPGMEGSNHFILAYATDDSGDIVFADPAHDIDGAWFYSHDAYPLPTVVRGGYDLFGQGQPFGLAFNYFTKGSNRMPDMDEATQTAMVQMEARQNAALTDLWRRFRQGKFAGADGIDGKIVELQGGTPLDFTPSYPPNS